jgi:hypothetical protein
MTTFVPAALLHDNHHNHRRFVPQFKTRVRFSLRALESTRNYPPGAMDVLIRFSLYI